MALWRQRLTLGRPRCSETYTKCDRSAQRLTGKINPILVDSEYFFDQRVIHGFAGFIRFQISLGHISRMFRTVHKHVIPGLILGRAGFGHEIVPLVAAHEDRVYIEYDTPVLEQAVVHRLTNMEQCFAAFGSIAH